MYSVSTGRITAPTRGEPAPIYLLSKILLQALAFPSATALYCDAFLIYFTPFKRKMNPLTFIQLET